MDFFKATFNTVSVLILMMGIGFFVAGKDWFKKNNGSTILSKLVVNIIIPMNLLHKIITAYSSPKEMLELVSGIPIPFISIGAMFLVAFIVAKSAKISLHRQGVFMNAAAMSNTVLVGIAVIEPLLGAETAPFSLIYYMINTIFFWTLGTYLIRKDGGDNSKLFSLASLKKILSAPPFMAFLIGIFLVFTGIKVPFIIEDTLSRIAGCATPLSMVFIGSIIRSVPLKEYKLNKDFVMVFVSRFLISPLVMTALCLVAPIPVLMKQTFFLMSCMPVMTQCGIMSKEYEADYKFASLMVASTTAACMLLVPLYIYLLKAIQIFG